MYANKKLGQNFLVNPGIVKKIVDASAPNHDDIYLEVGPGRGAVTDVLISNVKKLVCVEKDPILCRELELKFEEEIEADRVQIINEDILCRRKR